MKILHRVAQSIALTCLWIAAPAQATRGSFLITNAVIVDGTGAPRWRGAVRITDGRIAATGRLRPMRGEPVIDARGHVLAPGFIDTHSHHDIALAEHRDSLALAAQGVTTIVVGQDGGGTHPLAGFFRAVEAKPAAVNVAAYAGHNVIRHEAMGANSTREATPAEMARMKAMVAQDMRDGALGLSTGLEYDPGRSAGKAEVLALAQVSADHGGRYISHMRSEDRELWSSVDELLAIGRATHRPVQISHAKLSMVDLWGQSDRLLARLDAARAQGIDVTIDVYPYTYWHSQLAILWPDRDVSNRATAEETLAHLVKPEGLRLVHFPPDPALVGKTLGEIAAARGSDPVTTLMALGAADAKAGDEARIVATAMDERDIARLIAWPHTSISSDGMFDNAHPRGFGAFARVLRLYVREQKLLTLEGAVQRMTGNAAASMGLPRRGTIRVGNAADLVLFDPATIADRAMIEQPHATAVGVDCVWVNGVAIYRDGQATGAHPGRVLRRGDAR